MLKEEMRILLIRLITKREITLRLNQKVKMRLCTQRI